MKSKSKRGGLRNPPGGRPPLPKDQKRRKHSPTLAPGIKELAQTIAKEQGLPSWGYVLDELVKREASRLGIS
jgi:hypothetical protein